MYCYKCGSRLGSGRYCLRCGADVGEYKKIIRLSNSYYNAGLEKARLRDLTGAAQMLGFCLKLNKNHTEARNLLGLIYYETGEVTEALCQWVISKNLKMNDNPADKWLSALRDDKNHLDDMNQAVKKYNQALANTKSGSSDLAVVSLKRLVRQYPNFIRAHQLLALIYIHDHSYSKAGKVLRAALKVDAGNALCLKYQNAIKGKLGKSGPEARERIQNEIARKAAIGNTDPEEDVIVPEYNAKDGRIRTMWAVLAGAAAALCMYQFVIMPAMNRNTNVRANQEIAAYDSKLSDKSLEVTNLENQISDMQVEQQNMEARIAQLTGDDGLSQQYDSMLYLLKMYMNRENGNVDELVEAYQRIDEDLVDSDIYHEMYDLVKQYVTVDRISGVYKEAKQLYDDNYYKKAIPEFERVLALNPDYVDAIYYLAKCYEKRDDASSAMKYYQQIVDRFPSSDYVDEATRKVDAAQAQQREEQLDEAEAAAVGDDNADAEANADDAENADNAGDADHADDADEQDQNDDENGD